MLVRDSELSARGRLQAERLAERLSHLPLTAVVSSSMRRARATAAAVALPHGLSVDVEPDLDEVRIDESTRQSRYQRRSPETRMEPGEHEYASSAMAAVRVVPRLTWGVDGGESGAELRHRVMPAMERVVSRHPGGVVACVVHGGVLNAVIGEWAGLAQDMWFVPWHTGVSRCSSPATNASCSASTTPRTSPATRTCSTSSPPTCGRGRGAEPGARSGLSSLRNAECSASVFVHGPLSMLTAWCRTSLPRNGTPMVG
jgi:broad specificity phosphatase PhoE